MGIVKCLIFAITCGTSVNSHNYASFQQSLSVDQLIPPEDGCIVNWILSSIGSCDWCEIMFHQIIIGLTSDFSPSSVYTKASQNISVSFDLKGICFINWFLATDFHQLVYILTVYRFSMYRNEDWFVFIDMALTGEFLDLWKIAVEWNTGQLGISYPSAVLIMLATSNLHHWAQGTGREVLSSTVASMTVSFYSVSESCTYYLRENDSSGKIINPWNLLEDAEHPTAHNSIRTLCCYEVDEVIKFESEYFRSWKSIKERIDSLTLDDYLVGAAVNHLNFTAAKNNREPNLFIYVTHTTKTSFVRKPKAPI